MIGWIGFLPGQDDIGIPVFSKSKSDNTLFIAETRDDLTIVNFHEFYNEQEFKLSYESPASFQGVLYSKGDQIPIPFRIAGQILGINAGLGIAGMLADFEDRLDNPIIRNIAGILRSAEPIQRIHDDSLVVILRSKPPAVQGFKAIYQIVKSHPRRTFQALVAILAGNNLLAPRCPFETEMSTSTKTRVVLSFDGWTCLSTRIEEVGGELLLSDPLTCMFPAKCPVRPCA